MGRHDQHLIIVENFEKGCVARGLADQLLDPSEVDVLRGQLEGALAASKEPNVVVTLDTVTMMSSLALSVLISLREQAQARGGDVCLAAPSKRVRELLALTQLDKTFAIHDTVDAALASLG